MAEDYSLDRVQDFLDREVGVSDWMPIDQPLIDAFAEVTGDKQWIHLDVPEARAGPYGLPVAHGLLTLGLTVKLAESCGALPAGSSRCVNYGYDRVRFPAPVKAGERIRLRSCLVKIEARDDGGLRLTHRYTIDIEGVEKPALTCDCLGIFYP
jgi:acyl dehydratase